MKELKFSSAFLSRTYLRFRKRGKALKHKTKCLDFDTDPGDSFEWLTVSAQLYGAPTLILQLLDDNTFSVFARSSANQNRGKVLLRIEDTVCGGDAVRVVDAFERTVSKLKSIDQRSPKMEKIERIRRIWAEISLRIV